MPPAQPEPAMAGGDSVEASPATPFLPALALAATNSEEVEPTAGVAEDEQATPVPHEAATTTGGKVMEDSRIKAINDTCEDIRLRPHKYIGSVKKHTDKLWVYEGGAMVHRDVTYVPGLLKIFDGVLVSTANNKQHGAGMNEIRVKIDADNGAIFLYYNGSGIPVNIHKEDIYRPEAVFGSYCTNSKYKDVVVANILSTLCIVQTCDGHKKYKQIFFENMVKRKSAEISDWKDRNKWTSITFKPDLAKFSMSKLDDDIVGLMRKRVVDFAGLLGSAVTVKLDGEKLHVNSFLKYVDLYIHSASKGIPQAPPRTHEIVNDRWEVCVCLREGQQFEQISFVNQFATTRGGTHVDYVADKIATHVADTMSQSSKDATFKAQTVKSHLWIFINSSIDNPAFDSQAKDRLISPIASFGSTCELSQKFWKDVENLSKVFFHSNLKISKEPLETDGLEKSRVTGIQKLEDALCAGTKDSHECTLILTEGDSAKTLAMAGLSEVGRDYFGIYPLKGKVSNVRDANPQVMGNIELHNIMKILGLQYGKEYDSTEGLRYGQLMIMADQDDDGAHIKGLLINFIHSYWPSLLKLPFLSDFITPIIKATNIEDRSVLPFYTKAAYDEWKAGIGEDLSDLWSIKYYKGLGTSTVEEGSQYFKYISKHRRNFIWVDEEDDEAIKLAFSKKITDDRKDWLTKFKPGIHLDASEKDIRIRDFFDNEFILYSMANLHRSIPSMVDGCKPGQRKILFSSFKKNLVKETKVSDFAGYVSEHSSYRHGEQSLANTIVGMAQTFVGSNNINLLHPGGQLGTRLKGGKDSASPRYIYTQLSPITRSIFHKDDDPLLDFKNEDGHLIEPTWYIPIVPMVLINGAEGIGTGWRTYVPNFNPRDIVYNLRKLIIGDNENIQPLGPWFRHFTGASNDSATGHSFCGHIQIISRTTLQISELPIRMWVENYREFLDTLVPDFVQEYTVNVDTDSVDILVTLGEDNMKKAIEENILKKFNLISTVSTRNMNLFDADGELTNYNSPDQILEEFFKLRLKYYYKRKEMLLEKSKLELKILGNRVRFLEGVADEEIKIHEKKVLELVLELKEKGFEAFEKGAEPPAIGAAAEHHEAEGSSVVNLSGYDYLLSMPIINLTVDKRLDLVCGKQKLKDHSDQLSKASPESLWLRDLDSLEKDLDVLDQEDKAAARRRQMRDRKKLKHKQVWSGSSDHLTARPSKIPLMVIYTGGDSVDKDGGFDRAASTIDIRDEAVSSPVPVKKARV